MADKLLACPFCGGNDLEENKSTINFKYSESVECLNCHAEGPVSENGIEDWNKRFNAN